MLTKDALLVLQEQANHLEAVFLKVLVGPVLGFLLNVVTHVIISVPKNSKGTSGAHNGLRFWYICCYDDK